MIAVRVDLNSDERVQIPKADYFSVQGDRLMVYQGQKLLAQFRQWAYVIMLDEEAAPVPVDPATVVSLPKGAEWVQPPGYKPLGVKVTPVAPGTA